MDTDVILPKEFALVLLRKLAENDDFRILYTQRPAQALRSIGVPDDLVATIPASYTNIKLSPKSVFQTALYQLIDEVAVVCLCKAVPTVKLAVGEPGSTARPFSEH